VQTLESLQLESFNKSLNTRPSYIPTSNSLLERDEIYEECSRRGSGLICRLKSTDGTDQSIYTTPRDLATSGWARQDQPSGVVDTDTLATLLPALRSLEIPYHQGGSAVVYYTHNHQSRNAQGKIAPVCVCRFY
jgi:hypothetical protein